MRVHEDVCCGWTMANVGQTIFYFLFRSSCTYTRARTRNFIVFVCAMPCLPLLAASSLSRFAFKFTHLVLSCLANDFDKIRVTRLLIQMPNTHFAFQRCNEFARLTNRIRACVRLRWNEISRTRNSNTTHTHTHMHSISEALQCNWNRKKKIVEEVKRRSRTQKCEDIDTASNSSRTR